MKKSTKGAVAAVAAAALLSGGAGTYALWSATGTVPGASVSTGTLSLNTSACNTASWQLAHGSEAAVAYTDQKIVPGDKLTKTCAVTVTATGANLKYTLGVGTPTLSGDADLTSALVMDVTNDAGTGTLTGTQTVNATISVELPSAVTNAQDLTATLSALTLSANQV